MPTHENKGDSAITVGELNALHDINMTIKRYCSEHARKDSYEEIKTQLNPERTTVLASGGGNIGVWENMDKKRATALEVFKNFRYVILAQSVYFFSKKPLEATKAQYAVHGNMKVFLRDQFSHTFTRKNLQPAVPILSPDMAFAIGPIHRFFPPSLDIIWINRSDKERSLTSKPTFPARIAYVVTDWIQFNTPGGKDVIDGNYLKTHNGFLFLQRAKVVVTDRLHGYILSTLLDIPVVIIDNKTKKLTNYRNTWMADEGHAVAASNTQDAVRKAMAVLKRVNERLAPGF